MKCRQGYRDVVLGVLLTLYLAAGGAAAQVPRLIGYQGYLTAGGTPIDATLSIQFRVYDVLAGGTALYAETQDVAVSRGQFSVALGTVAPLNLAFDVPYFLGITIGADAEMTPRQPVLAAAYAMRSTSAETLVASASVAATQITGSIATAQIADHAVTQAKLSPVSGAAAGRVLGTDGANLQWQSATGTITAVTATAPLASSGGTAPNIALTGAIPVSNGGTGQTTLPSNGVLIGQGTGAITATVGGAGQVLSGTAGAPIWTGSPSLSGNLGVGVTPAARLHVNGTSWFQGDSTPLPASAGKGIAIGYSEGATGGYIFGFDYAAFTPTNLALNHPGGNVGIGTLTPTARLEVAGQDAVRLIGYQPYLTFLDNNAGNARSRIQGAAGNLHFAPESFIGGPSAMTILTGSGNVGIGTNAPTGRLEVVGQDALRLVGYQPFLTLLDDNAGYARGRIQNAGGSINFFPEGFFSGLAALTIYSGSGQLAAGTMSPYGQLHVETGESRPAIYGRANGTNYGVHGHSIFGNGVYGASSTRSPSSSVDPTRGNGVVGEGWNGTNGVLGIAHVHISGVSTGVLGVASPTGQSAYAGWFIGDTVVDGNFMVTGAKGFRIDHPQDPANRYLVHAAVESPDVKNFYDGIATTDAAGDAVVELPHYFETVNRDVRYQLTVLGQFAQAIVARKIEGNRFAIKTDRPYVEVSWQVTGIRQDPYMRAHPMVPEPDKPAVERGKYLHPELFGQPSDTGLAWPQGASRLTSAQAR